MLIQNIPSVQVYYLTRVIGIERLTSVHTPFYPGGERLARSRNLPVVYIELVRLGRKKYDIKLQRIADPPYTNLPLGAILERYSVTYQSQVGQQSTSEPTC